MKIFRVSGFVIVLVFAGLVWAIASLFVNGWVSDAIESQGMRVNGATVSVADSTIGWFEGSLQLQNLVLANPKDLMRNRIELEKLVFDLSIQELLKGHFHVDHLELKSIAIDQPRSDKAEKYDPNQSGVRSWEWPKAAVQKAQSVESDELLRKVDIRSPEMYQSFSENLSNKKAEWQAQAEQLPDEQKIEQYKTEYAEIKSKFDKANTLEKIKLAKDLKSLTNKIKKDKQSISSFKRQVETDIDSLKTQWKQLQNQVDKDTELAMSMVSLSPQGMRHLAASFLGEGAAGWVQLALDNSDLLKGMVQSSDKATTPPPQPREGIDVPFGRQAPKPAFWIKQTDISGKLHYNELQGSVTGKVLNIANQLIPGQPISAQAEFNLPTQADGPSPIGKMIVRAHHPDDGEIPLSARMDLAHWPIDRWQAADGAVVIEDALAEIAMDLKASGDKVELMSKIRLQQFSVSSESEKASSMTQRLVDVAQNAEHIELSIVALQQHSNTEISISSNLDELFFAKIREELQQKADTIKTKVKSKIESRIQGQRENIEDKLNQLTDFKQIVAGKIAALDELK